MSTLTKAQAGWLTAHPGWRVVSDEQHHRDHTRACDGKGPWPRDRVLGEDGAERPECAMLVGRRVYVRPPET